MFNFYIWAERGPLDFPSEKSSLLFTVSLMRRVEETCFKNSLVILRFSFFASAQAKFDFWSGHPCGRRS